MVQEDNHNESTFSHARILFCVMVMVLWSAQFVHGQVCPLSVNAGNDVAICNGSSTLLRAIQTGGSGTITYSWSPVDGLSNPNAANTIARPTGTTIYTVTATVVNCTPVTDIVEVTVNPLPDPVFFTNSFVGAECDGNVQFTITSPVPTAGMTYSWNFGDPSSGTSNLSVLRDPAHIFASYGNYGISLVVTSATGCQETFNKIFSYTTIPDPGLDNSIPFIQCSSNSGQTVDFSLDVFNNSKTKTTNTSYTINWGDGSSPETFLSSFASANHIYTTLGTFDLKFTATGSDGCAKTKTYLVFNGSNPALTVGNPGNTTGCVGSATFEFPIANTEKNVSATYSFDFGDGTIYNYTQTDLPSSVIHTYTTSSCLLPNGSYHLIAKATNQCFATTQDISPIIVSEPPIADFSFSSPHTGCINRAVTFKNNSLNGCYVIGQTPYFISSYKWYVDDVLVQTNNNVAVPTDLNYTFTTTGNHKVCLEAWNSCNVSSKDSSCQTICITPQPQALFDLAAPSGCKPFTVAATNTASNTDPCGNLEYTWSVSNYSASPNCAPGTSLWHFDTGSDQHTVNPSFVFENAGTYQVNQTVTNSCGSVTSSKNVTVLQPPTVSIISIPTVCQSFPTTIINPAATVTNCGSQPLTYAWSFPGGTPATSSDANPGPVSYSAPGTYSVSLIVTNECGPTPVISNSFIIKPTPTVDDIANQVKCKGESSDAIVFGGPIANTTYSWINSNTGIGLAASGTGNINSLLLTNTGTSVLTSTITVTPSFNGCNGPSKNFTITVHPQSTVNAISNISVCNNAGQNGIAPGSPVVGTTFSWTNNHPEIGLALNGTGNIPGFTAINTTTTPVVATITVTPSNATGCAGIPKTFTITINPTPGPLLLIDNAFCNGVITAPISFSNPVSGTTYTWTNSNPSIGLPVSGTGNIPSFTPVNTGAGPIAAIITVIPTANGCPGASQTFSVTVNPSPVITFSQANQTICTGEATDEVILNSTTAGVIFSWTAIIPAGIMGAATSGTNTIPVQTLVNTTNAPIVVTYKATAALIAGATCAGAEFIYTITVNPIPFITGNIPATVCNGLPFTVIPANSGGNNIPAGTTFIWGLPAISPVGALTGETAQSNPQLSVSQQLTNSTNNVATATYSVTPLFNGCTGSPFDLVVSVNPAPTTNQVSNITICNGAQSAQIDFTGDVAGVGYNWVSSNAGIGIGASGSGSILSFTAVNTASSPVSSTITVTPSANGCNGLSKTFTITVNPTPSINPITSIVICNSQLSSAITFSGNVPGTTFSWVNDFPSIGLAASGNGNIPGFNSENAGITPLIATISVMPSANGCNGLPGTFTITANPTPTVNDIPGQVKCKSELSEAIVFGGSVANTTYNWINSNTGIGLGASGTGNINPFLLTNTGTSVLTATLTITPTFNGCTGIAKTFTIEVQPVPMVNAINNAIVCNNAEQSEIIFGSTVSGTIFSWTNDIPGIGLASGGTGNVPVFTAVNTGTTPVIATITVTPSNATGCSGTVKTFTITVNPSPVTMALTDKAFCNGILTAPISFSNPVFGTTYTWTNSNPLIGLPGTGTGNISPFTPVNIGTGPITANITVVPIANGCAGPSQIFSVTVNPSPGITFSPGNQAICTGESTAEVTLNSTTAGVIFNWTAVTPAGISGTSLSGTNTIPVQTLVNTTNAPIVVTYKATAALIAGATCAGAEFNYTITVNPRPIVPGNIVTSVCNGSPFSVTPANGGGNSIPAGTTYTWSSPAINPAGALTGAAVQSNPQSLISQLLTNTTDNIATATYTVTPSFGGCAGLPFDVIVTVNPTPTVNPVSNITICNGTQNSQIDFTGSVTGTAYNWVSDNTSIGTGASGTGAIPAFTAVNNGTTPVKATITVTPSANGCNGLPVIFTITVHPILPVSVSISSNTNNICPGTNVTFTAVPVNGGVNPVYQWMVNGINAGTNSAVYTYAPADGDRVECQLQSDAICTSGNPALSNVVIMVVYSSLPAAVTIVESGNNICPGESVTFTAIPFNGGMNPVYQWFVNGLKVGTNQPVYSYNPVNGDIVSCQLISGNSCSSNGAANSNLVNMIVSPPALQPSFTIEKLNDCTPVQVIFRNTTAPGGVAYIWDFGDGTIDTTTTRVDVTHTFENFSLVPKVYNVNLTVITRFTKCFNVLTRQVTVNPEIIAGSPVNYLGCSPFVKKFENAYAGAISYRWENEKKVVLSTILQPTFTFTAAGKRDSTHIIYLIAVSATGCSDTIVNTVKVSPAVEMPSFTYAGKADCKSVTYIFNNTGPEGADLFTWNFEDGTINKTYHANEVVTHTFYNGSDVAMPFNVTLTSSSGAYCSLSVTQRIMIDPDFTAGFPVIFQGCNPLTRTFSNAYAGAKSYRWESADGSLLSNQMAPTLTFRTLMDRDSTHLVNLIVESVNGCIDTLVNKVIVRGATKAEFIATPIEGCAPLAVKFTNASSSQARSYQWDFNDGSDYSVVENPGHLFIDPQGLEKRYNVSLIAFNQFGCADTASHEVHLLPTPQADFTALPVEQTFPDRTIQLVNLTPPGNWTYTWNFGDQKPAVTGDLASYTYNLPGEYVISLTAKGALCQSVMRKQIIINPGTPVASFATDTSGCAPLRINFRNDSKNGSRYLWDFGNGNQSANFSPTITYFDQGTYTVKLNVFNQIGEMSSAERTIIVYPVPRALFKLLPNRVKIPGQTVTFFNYSENVSEYLWDFGDGTSSGEVEPVHQYTRTGLFDVTLFITSAEGCKDTAQLRGAVDVYSDELRVPNAFMPNKEGPSDGIYVPGDTRNHIFYPSVASGDVVDYELMIYNRWGNLLFISREVGRGWDGYYNGRLCSQDVYIWKIRCKFISGSVVTKTGDVTLIQ